MLRRVIGAPLMLVGVLLVSTFFWSPVKYDKIPYFSVGSGFPFMSVTWSSPEEREIKLSADPRIADQNHLVGEQHTYPELKIRVTLKSLLDSADEAGDIYRRVWEVDGIHKVEHGSITKDGWLFNIQEVVFPSRSRFERWFFVWKTAYESEDDMYIRRPVGEGSMIWIVGLVLLVVGASLCFQRVWSEIKESLAKSWREAGTQSSN